ncbi:MAG: 5-formyltetrahydrofolate cyclo-ligase [Eggerthellaceae bacterium]
MPSGSRARASEHGGQRAKPAARAGRPRCDSTAWRASSWTRPQRVPWRALRCLACEALERDGFQAVDPEELGAVVVPLVAFDDAGRRLGYGGGNYDQLLPACAPMPPWSASPSTSSA